MEVDGVHAGDEGGGDAGVKLVVESEVGQVKDGSAHSGSPRGVGAEKVAVLLMPDRARVMQKLRMSDRREPNERSRRED